MFPAIGSAGEHSGGRDWDTQSLHRWFTALELQSLLHYNVHPSMSWLSGYQQNM
jgi:hypothetical protein